MGDYVWVAHVRRPGLTPKLLTTWTGPWRVVGAATSHIYDVQNIPTGAIQSVHVARLRFYTDSQLHITAELKDVFQHAYA